MENSFRAPGAVGKKKYTLRVPPMGAGGGAGGNTDNSDPGHTELHVEEETTNGKMSLMAYLGRRSDPICKLEVFRRYASSPLNIHVWDPTSRSPTPYMHHNVDPDDGMLALAPLLRMDRPRGEMDMDMDDCDYPSLSEILVASALMLQNEVVLTRESCLNMSKIAPDSRVPEARRELYQSFVRFLDKKVGRDISNVFLPVPELPKFFLPIETPLTELRNRVGGIKPMPTVMRHLRSVNCKRYEVDQDDPRTRSLSRGIREMTVQVVLRPRAEAVAHGLPCYPEIVVLIEQEDVCEPPQNIYVQLPDGMRHPNVCRATSKCTVRKLVANAAEHFTPTMNAPKILSLVAHVMSCPVMRPAEYVADADPVIAPDWADDDDACIERVLLLSESTDGVWKEMLLSLL